MGFESKASTGGRSTWTLVPPSAAGLGLTPTGGRDGGSFLLKTLSWMGGWRLLQALVSMSVPMSEGKQQGPVQPGVSGDEEAGRWRGGGELGTAPLLVAWPALGGDHGLGSVACEERVSGVRVKGEHWWMVYLALCAALRCWARLDAYRR